MIIYLNMAVKEVSVLPPETADGIFTLHSREKENGFPVKSLHIGLRY